MLSKESIFDALSDGDLRIVPLDRGMIRPDGIDLMLGAIIYEQTVGSIINPYDIDTMRCYRRKEITDEIPFVLNPNAFILGQTSERITISTNLTGNVEGSSTLARLGVQVVLTSSINTGHGFPNPQPVTLEIKNHGLNPVMLYEGMHIAKLTLSKCEPRASVPYGKVGKYANGEVLPQPLRKKSTLVIQNR